MVETQVTDLTLLRQFRRCSHIQHRMGRFHGQGYLLILLNQHGQMTQRELASLTCRRSATLSEQLESMEEAGLIMRGKNVDDKRNIDIHLTDQGCKIAMDAEKERQEMAVLLFSQLTFEEKVQLHSILGKLETSWQDLDEQNQLND